MRSTASPAAIWAGLITLYIVWGTTYLGIRVAIETIPPFVMVGSRFAFAGLLLVTITALRERRMPRPTRRELIDGALVGAGLVAIGNGLVGFGEQTIPTGVAALLIALMPAWAAALGRILFGDRLPALAVVGIVTGLVGIAILSWPVDGQVALEPVGLLALLLAPIGWSLGSLYATKRAQLPPQPLLATGYQMIGGALVAMVLATITGELGEVSPAAISDRSLLAMLYLTIVGSLIGYTTYGWLLRVAPISRVTTYAYVNPIVAVALGAIVLSEPITPRTVIASVVIVVAVALIITARSRMVHQQLPGTRPARRLVGGGPRRRRRHRSARSALRQHRPRDTPSERHHRQHRIDPEPGREERAVRHVEAADRPIGAMVGADAAPWVTGVIARIRSHPYRAHLVRREDRRAVGREVERRDPVQVTGERRVVAARRSGSAPEPEGRRRGHEDVARAPGPGQHREADGRVAERGDARRIEAVVEPDVPGASERRPAVPAVAGDRDERRQVARLAHVPGVRLACPPTAGRAPAGRRARAQLRWRSRCGRARPRGTRATVPPGAGRATSRPGTASAPPPPSPDGGGGAGRSRGG